ncbi:gap junction beta-4 protein [Striga asiatica]|uniref:Gap junction beta-4 protein n=1 Tax=Striga asiatica TaxID=4170 RepID=A0A5A7PTW3_STRAF|nr:gap junction beta-4 protein [Striga asiatica]
MYFRFGLAQEMGIMTTVKTQLELAEFYQVVTEREFQSGCRLVKKKCVKAWRREARTLERAEVTVETTPLVLLTPEEEVASLVGAGRATMDARNRKINQSLVKKTNIPIVLFDEMIESHGVAEAVLSENEWAIAEISK